MTVTRHAALRITQRLTDAGLAQAEIAEALSAATRRGAEVGNESAAVLLARFPQRVNPAWGERSNGDTAWGIYRGGALVTVMLRRSTQPATAQAMRVNLVVM